MVCQYKKDFTELMLSMTWKRLVIPWVFLAVMLPPLWMQTLYLGKLSSTGLHHWLTASTVKFVDNWIEDGIIKDKFLMLELPNTIEHPTLKTRDRYVSYIPGAPLEIYLLKKIFPKHDTLLLVQIFNICNQFLISLTLMLFVFLGLAAYGRLRYWFAFIAFMTYQMLPQAVYLHSMVFFADIAVLLPLLLTVLLELIIRQHINFFESCRSAQYQLIGLIILQTLMLCWGILCDWLAVVLAICLYLLRVFVPWNKKPRWVMHSLQLLLLPGSIVGSYLIHLHTMDVTSILWQRFLLRSSQGTRLLIYFKYLVPKFFIEQLGKLLTALLFLGSIITLLRVFYKKITNPNNADQALCTMMLVLLLTCFGHLLLLPNHSIVHAHFAITKFVLVIILIIFCVFSAWICAKIIKFPFYVQGCVGSIFCLCFFFLWQLLMFSVPINSSISFSYDPQIEFVEVAHWLKDHAKFEEVYISKNISIPANPPHALALSRKPVHTFFSRKQLQQFLDFQPPNKKFFAILSETEIKTCGLQNKKIVAQIYDKNVYWRIIHFQPDEAKVRNCLACC